MFIGIGRFELFVPASTSLKDKRAVVQSIVRTVRHKFNAGIAEVDHQELWQRAALGVTCVAESGGHCRKMLQEIEKTIGRVGAAGGEIVDRSIQVISLEDL